MPQDESVVERVREYLFRHHRYTEKDLASDYQTEPRNYRDDTWEVPQRATRPSVVVKRYKTYEMLYSFFQITDKAGSDYTPLIVKRLCAHLFDRQGNQSTIVDIFDQKRRVHCSHGNDLDTIAAVAERYRQQADDHRQIVLKNIGRVEQNHRENQNREKGAGD